MIPELSAITRLGAVIKLEQPADVAHHIAIIAAGFDVLRSRGDINTERLILAKESINFLQTAFPTTHDHH